MWANHCYVEEKVKICLKKYTFEPNKWHRSYNAFFFITAFSSPYLCFSFIIFFFIGSHSIFFFMYMLFCPLYQKRVLALLSSRNYCPKKSHRPVYLYSCEFPWQWTRKILFGQTLPRPYVEIEKTIETHSMCPNFAKMFLYN